MRPIKVSGFLVVILTIVLLIPFLFPSHKLSVLGLTIRIPEKIGNKSTNKNYKDISKFKVLLTDSVNSPHIKNPKALKKKRKKQAKTAKNDSVRSLIQALEFPPNEDTLLNSFFRNLKNIRDNDKLIRILHYGDSQIEGDRITSYFRNQMQKEFGGGGVGLLPIKPVNSASLSYASQISDNWMRYSVQSKKKFDGDVQFGPLGNFFRFSNLEDTLNEEAEAWILLEHPNSANIKASKFNRVKVLMTGNRTPVFVELKKGDDILDADFYPSSKNLKIINYKVDTGSRNLLITLRGNDSPNVFGVSLDCDKGIAIDNIPLRGSSGLEFTRIYKDPYHQILKTLNVKLIILQFGVNAVISMSKSVDRFEKSFLKQLKVLRESHPEIPVIVVGVSDISENTGDGYVTHEGVEKIRDAQRRAAFATNCVFWDLYKGMGGKNSMPGWVFAEPALAQKDFTHLNALGARIIGEMFYRSLMNEYEKYLQTH
jgi:lysophospholipase L1-like esterase